MNILIIGNGGREHAVAWKVAQSPLAEQIYVAPGNAGTELENNITNVAIDVDDIESLVNFANDNDIALTIVGPEAALAAGITDAFNNAGLACFGPSQIPARLEISKAYSKEFMFKHGIPTAKYQTFTDTDKAIDYLKQQHFPVVIKADGLAAGKGVIIAQSQEEAATAIADMLDNKRFGDAGQTIVIEEFLQGKELSFIVMVDGEHAIPLASSQDYKRRNDGGLGPNTGGMGAYSPAPLLDDALQQIIMNDIINPTVKAFKQQQTPYVGFLYAGLMIHNGKLKVLEFNCRLGDPETQPIMMRLKSDLVMMCEAALAGKLNNLALEWDPRSAVTVVMASGGYPLQYDKGKTINGLNSDFSADVKVFHAGTLLKDNNVLTNGGRVLGVTALGDGLCNTRSKAYAAVNQITWPDCYYRHDIGQLGL